MKKLFYATLFIGLAGPASAQRLVGITTNDNVFTIPNASTPFLTTPQVPITGLEAGMTVAGADFRPNTGQLFLLARTTGSDSSRLYILDYNSGVATPVGSKIRLALGTGSIGFDFNPTVDRIRVVGANDSNYRLNPITGGIAAVDGALAYAAGDPNAAVNPSIGAVAYTNSYIGSEATTLYDYDETLNVLTRQDPPNNGTLNTIGASGIIVNPASRTTDMDIYYSSFTNANIAYFAANIGASLNDNLYTINLTTGAATNIGAIGTGIQVKDIAAVIDRTVPGSTTSSVLWALTRTNRNLISFEANNPGLVRSLTAVTGLTAGQTLVGIDFRPKDRSLYGLGYNTVDSVYQVYRINTGTGVATAVDTTKRKLPLGNGNIGFDFNPTVDRIRVTSSNRSNYRLNPDNGAIAATDSMLRYDAASMDSAKMPFVGSVAYTNSFATAGTTTLYGIDDSLATLVIINPPNAGVVRRDTTLGFALNTTDLTTDLDFTYDSTLRRNIGYMIANPAGTSNDNLYQFDAATRTFMNLGRVGNGIPLMDLAARLTFSGAYPAAIAGVSANGVMSLYPVPATSGLQVVLPTGAGEIRNVLVTDLAGRAIVLPYTIADQQHLSINVSSLAPGQYLLTVAAGNGQRLATRFVKN